MSVAALMLGFAGTASAQSANAEADALFKRGKDLEAAGKIAEACTAFEGSQKLDPAITTLLNLADCRERNQQFATAYGLYEEVARQLRDAPAAQQALAKTANARAAKLEPRLSKLTINVKPTPGLVVTRGGETVAPELYGQPLPVDGGMYSISARAPGYKNIDFSITVQAEKGAATIDVPALEKRPDEPATTTTATARPIEPVPPAPVASHGHKTLGLALVIGGGVGIAGSLVFGKLAMNKWSDAKDLCGSGSVCTMPANAAQANKDVDSSHAYGWVATGLGAAGVVAAGVGVYFLVRGGGEHDDRHAQLVPILSPTTAGLAIGGAL